MTNPPQNFNNVFWSQSVSQNLSQNVSQSVSQYRFWSQSVSQNVSQNVSQYVSQCQSVTTILKKDRHDSDVYTK